MTGLYNNAFQSDGQPGDKFNNFVILTMPSNGTPISKVHHRMPVFLDETTRAVWLDANSSFKACVDAITNSEVINGQSLAFV